MAGRWARQVVVALGTGAILGTVLFTVVGPHEADAVHARRLADAPMATAALRERVRAAVMEVDVDACGLHRQGTLTVLQRRDGPEGLTNAHVIDGASRATLTGADGSRSEVPVEGALRARDAATLDLRDVDPGRFGAVALVPGPTPEAGDHVMVAGYPDGRFTARMGSVRRIEGRSSHGGTTPVLVIDVAARGGLSGGVVTDVSGRAVGLVAARDPATGWTVAYPIGQVLGRSDPTLPDC